MKNHQRFCVDLGGRNIHFRSFGEGPAVFVLHGSPQSSAALFAQANAIAAKGLCAIAVDTPGNGLSSPLAEPAPSIEDYAHRLAELADALKLRRVGLYGFHTGAAIACSFAALYPDRTAAIALDGLCCWTSDERQDMLAHYLPEFIPSWDGAHMTWLWARLEEQTVFFPWYAPRSDTRMSYDVPPADAIHANAIDFLDSGDNYRAPYAAAFHFQCEHWLPLVQCPVLLATAGADPLAAHLERPPISSRLPRFFDKGLALYEAAADLLAAHPGDRATAPQNDSRGFIPVDGEKVHWRSVGAGSGRPLLLLHDAGGSSRQVSRIANAVGAARRVVVIDLPGHGDSHEGWRTPFAQLDDYADIVSHVVRQTLHEPIDSAGLGVGGEIAALMAARGVATSGRSLGMSLWRDTPIDASLKPEWDGAHLTRAFRIARSARLFAPWHDRRLKNSRLNPDLDPASVHAQAVDLIKADDRWLMAARLTSSHYDSLPAHDLAGDEASMVRALTS